MKLLQLIVSPYTLIWDIVNLYICTSKHTFDFQEKCLFDLHNYIKMHKAVRSGGINVIDVRHDYISSPSLMNASTLQVQFKRVQ
jgi:hypothetical protein